MKKLLNLIIVSLLFFSVANAQRHSSSSALTIRMWDRAFMNVTIQERGYEAPRGVFEKHSIRPGEHHITIARRVGNHGMLRIIYRGYIHIPRNTHVIAKVNRNNQLVVLEKRYIGQGYSYNERKHYQPNQNRRSHHYNMINISAVTGSMNRASFESDKLIIAKQALRGKNIYAEGVERIMRHFSFESARIEFAQFAYQHCIDPENYYRVNDAFSFSSSIRKLDEYINSHQGHRNGNYYRP